MKIISWNVNGIRAAYKKNFLKQLNEIDADIVCLQEIKAQKAQLAELFAPDLFGSSKYHLYSNPAQKSGYSGIAVLVKDKPLRIKNKLGMKHFDREGRMLTLEYPDFVLVNLYIPHGGRGKENLKYKLEAYCNLLKYFNELKTKNAILVGDFNVAHKEIDLARPKGNKNNIMFTPEERKQLDKIIELGFIDSFRKFCPKENGHYTWWPYLATLRERNIGWRIDYAFVTKNLAPKLKKAFILPKIVSSDHCPIGIEI